MPCHSWCCGRHMHSFAHGLGTEHPPKLWQDVVSVLFQENSGRHVCVSVQPISLAVDARTWLDTSSHPATASAVTFKHCNKAAMQRITPIEDVFGVKRQNWRSKDGKRSGSAIVATDAGGKPLS